QRCLGGELLQTRAMPVHRSVVEVGPKLRDRVLTVGSHENLPAETHDRLIGAAVPVVLEPLPVQMHHPFGMRWRPENVVMEETVAIVCGQFRNLRGADRTMPNERRYSVQRPRGQSETLQRSAIVPRPVDDLLPPQPSQQPIVLDRQRDRGPDVLPEPGVDRPGVATTQHQIYAATGQV